MPSPTDAVPVPLYVAGRALPVWKREVLGAWSTPTALLQGTGCWVPAGLSSAAWAAAV